MPNFYFRLLNLIFLIRYRIFDLLRLFNSKSINVSIIRKIQRPPFGGGNQFCLALHSACNRNQFSAIFNIFSKKVEIYLVDGNYISQDQLTMLLKIKESRRARIIHRIDGPTIFYKNDLNPDKLTFEINKKIATETIFQSLYTKSSFEKIGYQFVNPRIILNGFDDRFFFKVPKQNNSKRIRLIATSWSDNKKKGQHFLEYLDETVDCNKYEISFIGRVQSTFKNISAYNPVSSKKLGKILLNSDIYLALSENDPCSNALCDALGCNLPVVFLNSGGHPELVGSKGVAFNGIDDLWESINIVASNIEHFLHQSSNVQEIKTIMKSYFSTEYNS